METEIANAYALTYIITDGGVLTMIAEPIKMLLVDCLKAALRINHDTTHQIMMSCTPFLEPAIAQ